MQLAASIIQPLSVVVTRSTNDGNIAGFRLELPCQLQSPRKTVFCSDKKKVVEVVCLCDLPCGHIGNDGWDVRRESIAVLGQERNCGAAQCDQYIGRGFRILSGKIFSRLIDMPLAWKPHQLHVVDKYLEALRRLFAEALFECLDRAHSGRLVG